MTLTDYHERAKADTVKIGEGFADPADDWQASALLHHDDDGLIIVSIDGPLLSDENLPLLIEQMAEMVEENGVGVITFVLSVWAARATSGHPEVPEEVRPRDNPNRYEMLLVTSISADETQGSAAKIKRTDDAPPTLEGWQSAPPGAGNTFVTPFREALKRAKRRSG